MDFPDQQLGFPQRFLMLRQRSSAYRLFFFTKKWRERAARAIDPKIQDKSSHLSGLRVLSIPSRAGLRLLVKQHRVRFSPEYSLDAGVDIDTIYFAENRKILTRHTLMATFRRGRFGHL